ncbi:MAG: hypothetical protein PVH61_09020 [Candidatus Aminicenantes bacterium]|jgi:hypothetical protein
MRDDFTAKVKDILARRAGMLCSNPNCRKPTSGPHELKLKTVNIGVACHICSASPGGPRYDDAMTSGQRKSVDNGIWLCQSCAKLIDSDETRFTVQVLREWKRIAEESVKKDIEDGYSVPNKRPAIRVLVATGEFLNLDSNFKEYALDSYEIIRSVLLPSDIVDLLTEANTETLSQILMKGYDVVHFVAHVEHDGALVLGNEKVSPSTLATVLKDRGLKCALFMSCNSANVIGALHNMDISCVIAATGNLPVDTSMIFCRLFYLSISKGFSLPDAFAHANVVSSQSIVPFRDLRSEGSLCISLRFSSDQEIKLR